MTISGKTWNSTTFKRYQTCCNDSGGWFDAEDLYGPLNTYQAIEKQQNYMMLLWTMESW
jgi:hypothetical protein